MATVLDQSTHSRCFSLRRRKNQSPTEVEEIAPNRTGSNLPAQSLTKILFLTNKVISSLIAAQISAPVLSAPRALLGEQNRCSAAPAVLGKTELAESQNRTPSPWPIAPSDLVLHFEKNRKSLCVRTLHFKFCL